MNSMQTDKKIKDDKKAVITAYFKRQFGFLLAGIVLAMLSTLGLTLKTFLISNFGSAFFVWATVIGFVLSGVFFALTIISNLRMRWYVKRTEQNS